jgi:hypothetical protein
MTNSFKTYSVLFIISALFLAGVLLVALTPRAYGAGEPVVISEVAWMGTTISANDEWLELHNTSASPVSLEGWRIATLDGGLNYTIATTTCANVTVPANGYFLLERTDDTTLPEVTADCVYVGSLGNTGEVLSLIDSADTTINTIDASAEWPAGNSTTKETMQTNGTNWVTATGTPRAPLMQGSSISGIVFNDANKNKVQDDGEGGAEGLKVRIYAYPNAPWKTGAEGAFASEVATNATGTFVFENIPAGHYQVFVEERDGWRTQTLKRSNFLPTTLTKNERAELALTYDSTAQKLLGCAFRTTPCEQGLHTRLLNYRYFGVKVGESDAITGLSFANTAL